MPDPIAVRMHRFSITHAERPVCAHCGHQHTARLDATRRRCLLCRRVSSARVRIVGLPGMPCRGGCDTVVVWDMTRVA